MGIVKKAKNLIRKIFTGGSTQAKPVQRVQSETDVPLQTYIDLFGEDAVRERRFYNVGGGNKFVHPAWTVINLPSEHYGKDYMDLQWDLMSGTPMPIESGMAKVVFSRYTLEHVTDEAVKHFLADAHRALSPGGYLRLIVPDIEIYFRAYQAKDPTLFHRPGQVGETFPNEKFLADPNQASFEQRLLWTFASNVSTLHPDGAPERVTDQELQEKLKEQDLEAALNYCKSKVSVEIQGKYRQNHINWFNARKLERMMRAAGFQSVYRSAIGESKCPILRDVKLLEARRPEIALYMEAIR
jgi:predicted SAM-dependent methyltransferase